MSADPATPADRVQVLVVEDDPADRAMARAALEGGQRPWVVHEADSLAEARQALHDQPIGVVLLDLGLPDTTELEALDALVGHSGLPPVVVLTGRDEEVLGERTVRRGATDFLTKDMLVGRKAERVLDRVLRYAMARHRQRTLLERESAELRLVSVRQQALIDRISSDLQGPVAGLYGLVSTVAERLPSMSTDERELLLEKVLASANQLGARLTDLVADATSSVAPREELAIPALVSRALEEVEGRPAGSAVRLVGDIPPVWGQQDGLRDAVAELVRNAVLHAPAGEAAHVEVEAAPFGAGVRITVRDHNPPIPPTRWADVFEPGVTLDVRSTRRGMGLAVVRATAVQHGGSAWVEASDGGNAITITIPQRETARPA